MREKKRIDGLMIRSYNTIKICSKQHKIDINKYEDESEHRTSSSHNSRVRFRLQIPQFLFSIIFLSRILKIVWPKRVDFHTIVTKIVDKKEKIWYNTSLGILLVEPHQSIVRPSVSKSGHRTSFRSGHR